MLLLTAIIIYNKMPVSLISINVSVWQSQLSTSNPDSNIVLAQIRPPSGPRVQDVGRILAMLHYVAVWGEKTTIE